MSDGHAELLLSVVGRQELTSSETTWIIWKLSSLVSRQYCKYFTDSFIGLLGLTGRISLFVIVWLLTMVIIYDFVYVLLVKQQADCMYSLW